MPPAWRNALTGFAMGAADVVPGVSGGTVALLCGIYPRLLKAVTQFNFDLLRLVRQRRVRDAARHIDLALLLPLLCGLIVGLGCSILTLKRLLEHDTTRPLTLAWFCGMILASAWLLFSAIKPETPWQRAQLAVALLAGLSLAAWLGFQPPAPTDERPAAWFLFGCGMLGICAMILPGISGAMILLLLGLYGYLLTLPDKILSGQWSEALSSLSLFGLGCAVGLALFSRLLSWMLARHQLATLSLLTGLMIGSLVRLWPFQSVTEEDHRELIEWQWPDWTAASSWLTLAAVGVGVASIFAIQRLARSLQEHHQQGEHTKENG